MLDNIPIIVDGPNFINRIIDLGIKSRFIANQLSLVSLKDSIQNEVKNKGVNGCFESIEFICSNRKFGPQSNKFTDDYQTKMLNRFRKEIGAYVDIITLPGTSEKGVDATVSEKLREYSADSKAIVLVASDRDYVPVLNRLRHKCKIILISLSGDFPIELANEAYATIEMSDLYRDFFQYNYPVFSMNKFDIETCATLFAEADDRCHNSLRIAHDGRIFMVKDKFKDDLEDAKIRFETFVRFNGYVGPMEASDDEHIAREFHEISLAWSLGAEGYIDYPVETIWGKNDKDKNK